MRISDWSSDVCSSDLYLWHRGGAGVRAALLSREFGLGAADVQLYDLRARLLRTARGRDRLRPLWRPDRAQVDARRVADADGRLDLADSLSAELCYGRLGRAPAAVHISLRTGVRDRKGTHLNSSLSCATLMMASVVK